MKIIKLNEPNFSPKKMYKLIKNNKPVQIITDTYVFTFNNDFIIIGENKYQYNEWQKLLNDLRSISNLQQHFWRKWGRFIMRMHNFYLIANKH